MVDNCKNKRWKIYMYKQNKENYTLSYIWMHLYTYSRLVGGGGEGL